MQHHTKPKRRARVRIGIVGTGGVGERHALKLRNMVAVDLVACCDIDTARRERFVRHWRIPAAYGDYREMLARENLDGIVNSTPDALHAPVALAALRQGVAVFSEKPMATTLAEGRRMLAVARRSGAIHMLNFSSRQPPVVQHAAGVIRSGRIGRVLHVDASCMQSWLAGNYWGDWRDPDALWRLSTRHGSTGALGDLGSHLFDLVTHLCGDIVEIGCKMKTFPKGVRGERIGAYALDANDSFLATVAFREGGIGAIQGSRWATGRQNALRVSIYGERGAVELDLEKSIDRYRLVTGKRHVDGAEWQEVNCPAVNSLYLEFVRAIRSGKPTSPDFADGLRNQIYLDASFRAARTGHSVKVGLFRHNK